MVRSDSVFGTKVVGLSEHLRVQGLCLYERSADLTGGRPISMELAPANEMNAPQRLNEATILLLSTVAGVDAALLRTIELHPREHNWLRAPWYGGRPGGAMVLGDRIYLSRALFHAPQGNDRTLQLQWLLLIAHEVVHVRQAADLRRGRIGFGLWAAGQYALSFLRNGRHAYSRAAFEVEAEQGRKALTALLRRTGGIHGDHQAMRCARANDLPGMRMWLTEVGAI